MAESAHFPVELKGGGSSSVGRPKSTRKGKSWIHFLGKFLLFGLFIVAIPLFPSKAPDFVPQSLVTKFWELIHLLFIGVAVSYGLFCRRNDDFDFDSEGTSVSDETESYVSNVFRVSSIFDEGFDSSSGYYGSDRNVNPNLYSADHTAGESVVDNVNPNLYSASHVASESVVDRSEVDTVNVEQKKVVSGDSESGFEEFRDDGGLGDKNLSQACNFQYFQGESVVVVAVPDRAVNQVVVQESLNLPVRSLRSVDRGQGSNGLSDGFESSSRAKDLGKTGSPRDNGFREEFGDMDPLNLEGRFDETDLLSPTSSEGTEFGGDVGVNLRPRSHFRPLSVDERQFEYLKSKPLWSSESFSSEASSTVSDSPSANSPSHAGMEELGRAKMEELEKGKSFRSSYPPDSKQEAKKASLNAFHLRKYSGNGPLFEKSPKKTIIEAGLRNKSKSKKEVPLSSDMGRSASSKFDRNLGVNDLRDANKSKREAALDSFDMGRSASSKSDRNIGGDLGNASMRDKSKSKREAAWSSDIGRSVSPQDGYFGNPVGPPARTSKSKREAALSFDMGRSVPDGFFGNPEYPPVKTRASKREMAAALSSDGYFGNHIDPLVKTSKSKREPVPSTDIGIPPDSPKFDGNSQNHAKQSRGKSVRTVRSRKFTEAMRNEERSENHFSNKYVHNPESEEAAAVYKRKHEMRNVASSYDFDSHNHSPVHTPKFPTPPPHPDLHRRKTREVFDNLTSGPREDLEKEDENVQVSSDVESVMSDSVSEAGSVNTIDRKAGEFIAKFREQIRLQKMASIDRTKGHKYFR